MPAVNSADASTSAGNPTTLASPTVDTHMSMVGPSDVTAPTDSTTTSSLSTVDTHMSKVDAVDNHSSVDGPAAMEVAANEGVEGDAAAGSGQGMPTPHEPSS
jgi:hypothetical protein